MEIWFKRLRNGCRGYHELQIWAQITILVDNLGQISGITNRGKDYKSVQYNLK